MILFKTRRDSLREDILNYIRINLKSKFDIGDLYSYFDNNGEDQICTIESVERISDDVIVINHTGQLNNSLDYEDIVETNTDLLCAIADRIHLESLNYIRNET